LAKKWLAKKIIEILKTKPIKNGKEQKSNFKIKNKFG
jgi:hypothetical protein